MRAIVLSAVLVFLVARPVVGHEIPYVGAADQARGLGLGYADFECIAPNDGDQARDQMGPQDFQPALIGLGGVCFAGGHVQPVSDHGSTTVIASDILMNPVSAFYCQDNNWDALCGGPGDYAQAFCGSIYLHSEPDDNPPADPNWDTNLALGVYIDGPVSGSPLYTACAGDPPKSGTTGSVWHP